MIRLSPATLHRLPAAVTRPGYDRRALTPGILHLGLGAFARAHLAEHTDDALAATFGAWGVVGVNLRPPALAPVLDPQAGLYLRELRQGGACDRRVIGALLGGMTVQDDAGLDRAMALATDPAIRVITLTVTEKGYCHIPATGRLDESHPDIRHDLAHPARPRSVPGFVLRLLLARRAAGVAPPALISCDNVPDNGATLRACVLALAAASVPAAVGWIADHVAFPGTMVDRIVPATRPADIAALAADTGLTDAALVIGEPFRMWVIAQDARAVLPDWQAAGALLVPDVTRYEVMKMRVVNGMQTALCHLGALAGHRFMAQAMADPLLAGFAGRMIRAEVEPHLPALPGIDTPAYIGQTEDRLRNTALFHATAQIATDGSRKIRQRLLDPLGDARQAGSPSDGLLLAVAGWLTHVAHCAVTDDSGVADPVLPQVARVLETAGPDALAYVQGMLALDQVFPPTIAALPGLADALADRVAGLRQDGVQAVLARHLAAG